MRSTIVWGKHLGQRHKERGSAGGESDRDYWDRDLGEKTGDVKRGHGPWNVPIAPQRGGFEEVYIRKVVKGTFRWTHTQGRAVWNGYLTNVFRHDLPK